MSPERLGALKAPAGLDIGAVSPDEIAVSILAEIIQHRRSAKPPAEEPRMPAEAIDPTCGMTVEIATAEHRSETAGGNGVLLLPTLQDDVRPEPRYPFLKVADLSEIGPGKSKLEA